MFDELVLESAICYTSVYNQSESMKEKVRVFIIQKIYSGYTGFTNLNKFIENDRIGLSAVLPCLI